MRPATFLTLTLFCHHSPCHSQWLSGIRESAASALEDRPLAGALLSQSDADQTSGFLGLLGLDGGSGGNSSSLLQQMTQSVRDSIPGSESESESGGGGFFDGGVLGGFGQGQLLDGNLMERVIKMLQGGGCFDR